MYSECRSHFTRALRITVVLMLVAGCEREERQLDPPPVKPDPRAQAAALSDFQPGKQGPGMRMLAAAGGYHEQSAYEVAQGKQLYRWFNCVGCHAQGGGAIGPALMDDDWLYGKSADAIFTSIVEGRPNGMPAFRGRIPEQQVWQLVAYVRSMSGLVPSGAEPNRSEGLLGAPPENLRDAQRPDEKH